MVVRSFFAVVSSAHAALAKNIKHPHVAVLQRSVLRIFQTGILFIAVSLACRTATAQSAAMVGNIIQITGVTMTADSLRAVAGVEVVVKGKNRGVESSRAGVFSIVVSKGDTLQFNAPGYRTKEYAVPRSLYGSYFSLVQLMVQDTFYLPETIVRPLPTRGGFDYAFKHWSIPDDALETARKNTNAFTLRALAVTLPRTGSENQAMYQQIQQQAAVYYGQARPMQIMNPLAWAEFFESWKRGDYRRK